MKSKFRFTPITKVGPISTIWLLYRKVSKYLPKSGCNNSLDPTNSMKIVKFTKYVCMSHMNYTNCQLLWALMVGKLSGSFTNYVYKILPIIDHLPIPWIFLYGYKGKPADRWHFQYHLTTYVVNVLTHLVLST